MEYRKIKPEEQERAIFILSQAFFYKCEGEYKQLEQGKFQYQDFVGAFNDDGEMMALFATLPHYVWLDGYTVKSGGIGGVASLTEHRRGGQIRKLFEKECDRMYEEGYTLSYLYPFSHSYYRKFGYELCCTANKVTADPKDLLRFKVDGYAKQFEPGENGTDPGDIVEIYNKFAPKYNTMLHREWQWEKHLEHDPVKTTTRTYILYDKNDKPQSYVTYNYKNEDKLTINIKDMAWVSYDAMYSLMGFVGRLCSNIKEITFTAPPEMHPEIIWQEPYDLKTEIQTSGMARIINAEKALRALRKPTQNGEFTIKINDEFMEQNNKSYKVVWEDKKTTVTEYDGKCDIECSVQTLAQILIGYIGLDSVMMKDDVVVNGNAELLRSVFIKKDVFIADYF